MAKRDSEAGEWQQEVSEQADDGSGCAEMWNQLSEKRSNTTRREVLKKVGTAAGVSVTTLTQVSREVSATEVNELSGEPRGRVLSDALSDERTKKLRQVLLNEGYRPRVSDATVVNSEYVNEETEGKVDHSEKKWQTVVIPFGKEDNSPEPYKGDTDVHISWTNSKVKDNEVVALRSIRREPSGEEPYWDVTEWTIENGSIVTTQEVVLNLIGCPTDKVNPGCLSLIAGQYATAFTACATCMASGTVFVPACGLCLAAISGYVGSISVCDWCEKPIDP